MRIVSIRDKFSGVWNKIKMVAAAMLKPVLEKIHLQPCVELRRQRRSRPGRCLVSVRRKPDNMRTMFEDGAGTMKPKNLTLHPPKGIVPTEIGTAVLGGNQIISSWATSTNYSTRKENDHEEITNTGWTGFITLPAKEV
jgi:hypothetical protein